MPNDFAHQVYGPRDLADVGFVLRKMVINEHLGRPFEVQAELFSKTFDVDPYSLLGRSLSVEFHHPDGSSRFINGLVSQFSNRGHVRNWQIYHVVLRPWLWFLTRTSDCRIFQNLTVPEIIEDVFREKNRFTDFDRKLDAAYRKRDYCVQYRESDFNFVSRLMEEEGIYYFFKHEKNKHVMVMTDSVSGHASIPGTSKLPFRRVGDSGAREEHVYEWQRTLEVQSGAYVLKDFDFEKPKVELVSQSLVAKDHELSKFEVYDYPGEYKESKDGDHYVRARLESLQRDHVRITARTDARGMMAGGLFQLTEHDRGAENGEYLVVSAEIAVNAGELELLDDDEDRFDAKIEALESKQPFRPASMTRKPIVQGPQTAIVVGEAGGGDDAKSGDDIVTDKFGRVRVKFHWDRRESSDENSSCWIRVAQTWAGKNWGGIQIPRVGQEVIVDFLEGDPDQPIITGRVYNADQMPPYTLPTNRTQSGVKSRSSKEGTPENFNELRFEDKKDAEEVYFHAEKDFNRVVENNDTLKVGHEKKDKGDQSVSVFNNQSLTIGADGCDDGSQSVTIRNNRSVTIQKKDDSLTVSEGNRSVTVSKGDDTHVISKGNREVTVSMGNDSLTVSKGNCDIKVTAGSCTIEAGKSIELKVGPSTVTIDMKGITMKAPQIAVQGQLKTEVSAATTEIKGMAAVNVQGGMVKIN